MFELRPNNLSDNFSSPSRHNHTLYLNRAINQFNQARWDALIENAKCVILGHARTLRDLESIPMNQIHARHYSGIKPVSLDRICGTLGRTADFDHHFHPLDDRIRDRWVSIATARSQNIPLAPVELIQVGNCYFVKDGHHRISVAHSLGETAIDAEITLWEVCCPLPWEKQPSTNILAQTT